MAYVFGDTLICDDADSAKLVTFSAQVGGARSVTLDGDVYDPSGTLSGGSAPSGGGNVLVKVQELLEAERKFEDARTRLRALEEAEEKGREGREKWRGLRRELEIKEHEARLLEEQVEGSNAARVCACFLCLVFISLFLFLWTLANWLPV
jgi:structural maintenance of chromosome 2